MVCGTEKSKGGIRDDSESKREKTRSRGWQKQAKAGESRRKQAEQAMLCSMAKGWEEVVGEVAQKVRDKQGFSPVVCEVRGEAR